MSYRHGPAPDEKLAIGAGVGIVGSAGTHREQIRDSRCCKRCKHDTNKFWALSSTNAVKELPAPNENG